MKQYVIHFLKKNDCCFILHPRKLKHILISQERNYDDHTSSLSISFLEFLAHLEVAKKVTRFI